jgi:hypothetical protein
MTCGDIDNDGDIDILSISGNDNLSLNKIDILIGTDPDADRCGVFLSSDSSIFPPNREIRRKLRFYEIMDRTHQSHEMHPVQ